MDDLEDKRQYAVQLAELKEADVVVVNLDGKVINASGHQDELRRGYSLLSICGLGLAIDSCWTSAATALYISIYNGGPPGVLYELLVAGIYYFFIAASLAELASSVPSSGGVYHWASLTPGARAGRVVGFYAGIINFMGWLVGLAAVIYLMAELIIQMYAVYHPAYIVEQWHLFIVLTCLTWICIGTTIFFNRILPYLQRFGMFMVVVGGLISMIVVVTMPEHHASNSFVWSKWENQTGWNNGVSFLLGVLNGAFTIGTPDSTTHIAEELKDPKRDLPKAIALQMVLGVLIAFVYLIALMYGINDLDAVLNSNGSFPLAEAYNQATGGNRGATFGLLFIVLITLTPGIVGTCLVVGRSWWTLARDGATPFPKFFARVNERLSCPVPAAVLTGILITALGAITLGSATAFTDLAGSFIILSTTSYALAIFPHLLTRRRNMPRGAFWMSGAKGFVVNGIACLTIAFFNIIYCFPYFLPTTVEEMNYNSVILSGTVILTTIWWLVYGLKNYKGARVSVVFAEKL